MDQRERRNYLIKSLIKEQKRFHGMEIVQNETDARRLLRFLMNVRMAARITREFEDVQDAYLQEMMDEQGYEKPAGRARITPGFNLPCKYVLHTVGPIVQGSLTKEHEELLKSCYESCLKLADENGLKSIAFCCISTGVFMFPSERAAEIAVKTVREYRKNTNSGIEVIFNVWKDIDYEIYRKLFG